MILGVLDIDYLTYIDKEYEIYNIIRALSEDGVIKCADCNYHVGMHGTYKRTVIFSEFDVRKITIVQVKCKECRKVHAVIPDFISPNKQYTYQQINIAINYRKQSVCCADESTIRRWRNNYKITGEKV